MFQQILMYVGSICCAALLVSLQPVAAAEAPKAEAGSSELVYVATNDKGIYAYRFAPASGQFESIGKVAEIIEPTWLAVSPNQRFLYSVSDGPHDGSLSSYGIDARTGKLKFLNTVSSGGQGSTYVIVDRTGKALLANNFSGGQVLAFQLNRDGSIGRRTAFIQHTGSSVVPPFQTSARPHEEVIAADNRHVIVPDLGSDRVYTYLLDPNRGTLQPGTPSYISVTPGFGPRHFAFHPNGHFAYLLGEIGSGIIAFSYASDTGELKPIQTVSTILDNSTGSKSPSEIQIDRSGRFLYMANRGDSTILVFSINPALGTLTFVQRIPTQGSWPRGMALDLTEQYLFVANEHSDNVTVFKVDSASGKLIATGQVLGAPQAASVLFVPAGRP